MVVIRDATLADIPQVAAINSYYIANSVLTFLQTPPPPSTFLTKFHDIKSRGLPYLVAVDEETKHEDGNELVLGYSCLSSFRGHMLSYAPTVELTIFVHPEHQSRSLGSKLLSSILAAAPKCRHVGFEITASTTGTDQEETPSKVYAGEDGKGVPIRNILAVMAVNPDGPDGGDALRRWYINRGFVERGRMEKVGFKKGHWIDTIYLQYTLE